MKVLEKKKIKKKKKKKNCVKKGILYGLKVPKEDQIKKNQFVVVFLYLPAPANVG